MVLLHICPFLFLSLLSYPAHIGSSWPVAFVSFPHSCFDIELEGRPYTLYHSRFLHFPSSIPLNIYAVVLSSVSCNSTSFSHVHLCSCRSAICSVYYCCMASRTDTRIYQYIEARRRAGRPPIAMFCVCKSSQRPQTFPTRKRIQDGLE
ncbi:hypothetical protein L227DRAFT_35502 [Lentinus tigrinus ALCF2SS1-6]|uniref:Secreted protein n=1 Tax=Lentinus tigrinus ALCF2SS1-6 TaxID=1328759 RepID=A0A5C2SF19_9APHY|nr:hypothetical protein L227DRAFT_35502 [Lentinus tigrinus ALCF2SS1-6]